MIVKLFKLAGRVVPKKRRVDLQRPTSCPVKESDFSSHPVSVVVPGAGDRRPGSHGWRKQSGETRSRFTMTGIRETRPARMFSSPRYYTFR